MNWHGLVYVLASVTLVVAGQTTLRAGMIAVGPIDGARLRQPTKLVLDVVRVPTVWIGFVLYVVSGMSWILALATVPLSVAYPFLGLSYVGVAALAVIKLGEWITPAQWIGIFMVVVGVIIVALS